MSARAIPIPQPTENVRAIINPVRTAIINEIVRHIFIPPENDVIIGMNHEPFKAKNPFKIASLSSKTPEFNTKFSRQVLGGLAKSLQIIVTIGAISTGKPQNCPKFAPVFLFFLLCL